MEVFKRCFGLVPPAEDPRSATQASSSRSAHACEAYDRAAASSTNPRGGGPSLEGRTQLQSHLTASSKRRDALLDAAPYLVTAITANGVVLYQNEESVQFYSDLTSVNHGNAPNLLSDLFSLEDEGVMEVSHQMSD